MTLTYMQDGTVVNEIEGRPIAAKEAAPSEPSGNPPILHSDLIGCATDLVLCRETALDPGFQEGEFVFEERLADVRAAAAAYLIRAFDHARCGHDD